MMMNDDDDGRRFRLQSLRFVYDTVLIFRLVDVDVDVNVNDGIIGADTVA